MKVLIVDDEIAIGKVIETVFKNKGHETRWVENADNIVQVVEEFKPDVVLLDVNMPGKSGFDALKELREWGYDKPIIILTILSQDSNIDRAYEIGATDYITKPFSLKYLVRKVEKLLNEN